MLSSYNFSLYLQAETNKKMNSCRDSECGDWDVLRSSICDQMKERVGAKNDLTQMQSGRLVSYITIIILDYCYGCS